LVIIRTRTKSEINNNAQNRRGSSASLRQQSKASRAEADLITYLPIMQVESFRL